MEDRLLGKLNLNEPATLDLITQVESQLGLRFPKQYVDFLLKSNGAEGWVGQSYVAIWPIEQVIPYNSGYAVEEFTPGLIYYGSDGGGMAYAFDKRSVQMPIVEFPFELIHIEYARQCGKTFSEFLQALYDRAY